MQVSGTMMTSAGRDTAMVDDAMRKGLQEEIQAAAQDWFVLRRLRDVYHAEPVVRNCQVHVRSVVPAEQFAGFLVVYVESELSVAVPLRKRRVRDVDHGHVNELRSALDDICGDDADGQEEVQSLCSAAPSFVHGDTLRMETLHFVNARLPSGFQVQSVRRKGYPMELQCYARQNIGFALACFFRQQAPAPPQHVSSGAPFANALDERWWLPQNGTILILGMGGNVMVDCLVRLVPDSVTIRVAEIERAVLEVCQREGLMPATANVFYEHQDALTAVNRQPLASCCMIFLDCFDPISENMLSPRAWLIAIRSRLTTTSPAGLLIVNTHDTSKDALSVFASVFGAACVQCLEICGHPKQLAVVCSTAPFADETTPQFREHIAALNRHLSSANYPDNFHPSGSPNPENYAVDKNLVAGLRRVRVVDDTNGEGKVACWCYR